MLTRCNNTKNTSYNDYGGRGITVCERWSQFIYFLEDMGEPSTEDHSLDRINNNLGYKKSNCRWGTKQQQMRNTRRNHLIEFDEKILCLSEWEEQTGIPARAIRKRLKYGWTVEKALFCPKIKKISHEKKPKRKKTNS